MDFGALDANYTFVSGVYRWFRWLRYHPAYCITSPEEEKRQDTLVTIDHLASTNRTDDELTADAESNHVGRDYKKVSEVPLAELRAGFGEKVKQRWTYVHTNAMGIAYMLDSATDLDDFVGADGDEVDNQICQIAAHRDIDANNRNREVDCRDSSIRNLIEDILRDYWNAKSEKQFSLIKRIAEVVIAIPTSSAASERAWSIMDRIHTKRRNRLLVTKLKCTLSFTSTMVRLSAVKWILLVIKHTQKALS
ncbi:hypothetical protein PHMEG_00010073 [Phytophthora megakarya]|uniref:HAT C-terminal dimerisation domain-containing protein n=1 Tax=Phytophthora megakarya TaxID=4795 RepID=A0A225WFJ4_9STRA|nr:hypothetical protein PHMEG_00010073 [Phytophthora megakarya]